MASRSVLPLPRIRPVSGGNFLGGVSDTPPFLNRPLPPYNCHRHSSGCSPARENQCLWDRCLWLVRERDWDDDAFKGDEAPAPVLADSSFSFIALSTAVVSGDLWGKDIEGLADSDFSFIPFSTSLVSSDVWGGLSSAML